MTGGKTHGATQGTIPSTTCYATSPACGAMPQRGALRDSPQYPAQHGATHSVTTGRTRSTTHATRHGAAWREVQPSCGPVAQHEGERERCGETWQPRNAGERFVTVSGRAAGRPPGPPPPLPACGGGGNGVGGMVDSGWVRSGSIILGACRNWQHGQPNPRPHRPPPRPNSLRSPQLVSQTRENQR